MNKQSGFTIIELVVVIVILGILAAVAIPRFIDLSDQAEQAAVQGVAGALSSGVAINFAAWKAGNPNVDTIGDCQDAAATLQGGLPDGYTITGPDDIDDDDTAVCTVTTGGASATFTAIGTAN